MLGRLIEASELYASGCLPSLPHPHPTLGTSASFSGGGGTGGICIPWVGVDQDRCPGSHRNDLTSSAPILQTCAGHEQKGSPM